MDDKDSEITRLKAEVVRQRELFSKFSELANSELARNKSSAAEKINGKRHSQETEASQPMSTRRRTSIDFGPGSPKAP